MLTDPQQKIMRAVFDNDSRRIYAGRSALALLARLQRRKLLQWDNDVSCGRSVTAEGLKALHEWYRARWIKDGCMAYLEDLNDFETKMKERTK